MCAISKKSYDWDWRESEGKRSKPILLPHMQLWLDVVFPSTRRSDYMKLLLTKRLSAPDVLVAYSDTPETAQKIKVL